MEEKISYKYCGLVVTIVKTESNEYKTYLSDTQDNFENILNMEEIPLCNSLEEASNQAGKFINDHQWQEIDTKDNYLLEVRRWWQGKFGYRVQFCGSVSDSGFSSYKEAKEAGEKKRDAIIAELKVEMEAGKKRIEEYNKKHQVK